MNDIEEAFALIRLEAEQRELPMADQVRRYGDRRARRRAAVATLAAVVVGVVATISVLPLITSPKTLPPTRATDASPALSGGEMSKLIDQAREDVGIGSAVNAKQFAVSSGPLDTTVQNVAEAVPENSYTLAVTCRGAGKVTVTWSFGGRASGDHIEVGADGYLSQTGHLTCAPASVKNLPALMKDHRSGTLTVRIEPDSEALNHAAYAYVITTD
ncbi:hypothetical protein [Catellatospora tritici]|uniref:hypothetical protein n=1 Tax=Catellatospora tritici TaxID=2851566 RepID=UPI001C2D9EB1|nr:hypothetical protein [Catellatospora tritici]MBV1853748.1 hypothetical protein [Catellatospora tritici]